MFCGSVVACVEDYIGYGYAQKK